MFGPRPNTFPPLVPDHNRRCGPPINPGPSDLRRDLQSNNQNWNYHKTQKPFNNRNNGTQFKKHNQNTGQFKRNLPGSSSYDNYWKPQKPADPIEKEYLAPIPPLVEDPLPPSSMFGPRHLEELQKKKQGSDAFGVKDDNKMEDDGNKVTETPVPTYELPTDSGLPMDESFGFEEEEEEEEEERLLHNTSGGSGLNEDEIKIDDAILLN